MIETPLDSLIDATLPGGLAVARVVAERVHAVIADRFQFGADAMYKAIRREISSILPHYAQTLQDSLLAAWLSAASVTAEAALPHVPTLKLPLPEPLATVESAPAPVLRLPMIETAAKWLAKQPAMPRSTFEQLANNARTSAFTVARLGSQAAVAKIQDALVESINEGGTLKMFQRTVSEALDSSPLSEASIETIYRTNLGRAYSAGMQTILANPLVGDELPYLLYSAVHDSRTRPEHLMMERLGLDGGPVYRADDPVMERFFPPWAWNCRCFAVPLSLEDAARRYHVSEAIKWLESGSPPLVPTFVKHPPFDLPPGWVPVQAGQFAAAA